MWNTDSEFQMDSNVHQMLLQAGKSDVSYGTLRNPNKPACSNRCQEPGQPYAGRVPSLNIFEDKYLKICRHKKRKCGQQHSLHALTLFIFLQPTHFVTPLLKVLSQIHSCKERKKKKQIKSERNKIRENIERKLKKQKNFFCNQFKNKFRFINPLCRLICYYSEILLYLPCFTKFD